MNATNGAALGLALLLVATSVILDRPVFAQTPVPVGVTTTATGSVTQTPRADVTPSPAAPTAAPVTPTTVIGPTVISTPVVLTTASVGSHLIEDTNGDGKPSVGDRTNLVTLVELSIWGNVPAQPGAFGQNPAASGEADVGPFKGYIIDILSANDGSFTFKNLPAGDYSLWVWWAGGFVNGATERLPDLYRAVFHVEKDGSITAPSPLPSTWPESFGDEPFDPVKDHVSLNGLPDSLLLKPAPAHVVPYPVSGNGALIRGSGSVDVGALFSRSAPTTRLPDIGQGSTEPASAPFVLLAGSVVVSLLLARSIAWSRRRAG